MAFDSTSSYIATDALKQAVNAAVTLERPLLIDDRMYPMTLVSLENAMRELAR